MKHYFFDIGISLLSAAKNTMNLPKFDWSFNFGHVLTIIGLAGSVLWVWRASEMQAVELRMEQRALRERIVASELLNQRVLDKLEVLSINEVKVATILDEHIKLSKKYSQNP